MTKAPSFFKKYIGIGRAPVWIAGISGLIFGMLLLFWPSITAGVILHTVGSGLFVAGLYNIAGYFLRKSSLPTMDWRLCIGLILACAGICLIVFKVLLLSLVPLLFCVALIVGSITKLQVALNMRRLGYQRWYFTLTGATISLMLGLLIALHPFGTGLILVRFIGGTLVVESVQDLCSYRRYKRVVITHFTR